MSEGGGGAPRTGGGQDFAGIRGRGGAQGGNGETSNTQTDFNEQWLIIKGRLDPSVDNRGYANITRVVRDGGISQNGWRHIGDRKCIVCDACSRALNIYPTTVRKRWKLSGSRLKDSPLTIRHCWRRARKVQSEMLNRVTVDFGDASKYGLSSEELLSDQRSSPGYSGAFLKTFFEMCRYWFIITTGKYRSVSALTNVNTNLQIAPISIG